MNPDFRPVHRLIVVFQAWGRRQKINPRRALTKKVKLTQGEYPVDERGIRD